MSLNVLVTTLICARLLRMRAITRGVLPPELARTYTSVAAMLIESAAPFTALGIGLVVTEAQGGPLAIAFSYVWGMFCVECFALPRAIVGVLNVSGAKQSLSPQMIILRVAMGHGLVKETVEQISTGLVFAEPPAKNSEKSTDGAQTTLDSSEGPTVGSSSFAQVSDSSIKKQRSAFITDVVSIA